MERIPFGLFSDHDMIFLCLYIVRIHNHLFLDGVSVYAFEFLAKQR